MVSYLTTLFLGKSPEVNLPVHVLSAHFSPVTGSLLFLKQLIPKREIDTSDTYYTPANCVCGMICCFQVVRPSVRTNESVSVTFCFLNILKTY